METTTTPRIRALSVIVLLVADSDVIARTLAPEGAAAHGIQPHSLDLSTSGARAAVRPGGDGLSEASTRAGQRGGFRAAFPRPLASTSWPRGVKSICTRPRPLALAPMGRAGPELDWLRPDLRDAERPLVEHSGRQPASGAGHRLCPAGVEASSTFLHCSTVDVCSPCSVARRTERQPSWVWRTPPGPSVGSHPAHEALCGRSASLYDLAADSAALRIALDVLGSL